MFDVAFAHDIRKEPKKDIINSSTYISPVRFNKVQNSREKSTIRIMDQIAGVEY